MSNNQKNIDCSDEQISDEQIDEQTDEQIIDILNTAIKSLDNLAQVHLIQILNNSDEIARVKDTQELQLLVEHMLRSPLRRQAGRIRGLAKSLEVVLQKLNNKTK